MKQVIIENIINISSVKILNQPLSIIPEIKPLAFGFVLAAVLCNYQQAIAQTPNPGSLPSDRLEDIPTTPLPSDLRPQPSEQQLLPPNKLPESQIPEPDDLNVKFKIERIEVIGSTIFKPKDFAAVTSSFVGRELTFAELLQIKDAITKLYTDKGYVTTGALITPQTVEAGTIQIQVFEGSLQEPRKVMVS